MRVKKQLIEIGWRELARLLDITRHPIKVKIDTGARTSALHATELSFYKRGRTEYVKFKVHPNQDSSRPSISVNTQVEEFRNVKSSTGHVTRRPVISVRLKMGEIEFETEVTLVNRDLMGFRMLLGRTALKNRFLVNVGKSFLLTKKGHK